MKFYVAKEFSPYPFGRGDNDDEFNGTRFRKLLLQKFAEAQRNNERLEVILDDVFGLGGSFIDEGFGKFGEEMKKENVVVSDDNLRITGDMPVYDFYVGKIWRDINKYNQPDSAESVA